MLTQTTPIDASGWGLGQPEAWPWVLAALAALALASSLRSRGAKDDRKWLGPRYAVLTGDVSPTRQRLRAFCSTVGAVAVAVALLQPTAGRGSATDVRRPIDLVIGLDVSRSMLARDLVPTRLGAAQSAIRSLAQTMSGDALSLVAFAGTARTLIPLTRDGHALGELVELAEPSAVATGGTDLGEFLRSALTILQRADARRRERSRGHPRRRAVLLVTDGEDLAGQGLDAARECAAAGVHVFCLGVGSQAGTKIALPNSADTPFVVDRAGREVVSAVDRAGLSRIAAAGRGRSLFSAGTDEGQDPTSRLQQLYSSDLEPLGRAAPDPVEGGAQPTPRFQLPLLLAGIAWLLAIWLSRRRVSRVAQELLTPKGAA